MDRPQTGLGIARLGISGDDPSHLAARKLLLTWCKRHQEFEVLRALEIIPCLFVAGIMTCATAQVSPAVANAGNATPDLTTIVSRMQQAEQESRSHSVPYNVTRQYQLSSGTERPSSEVLAKVSFTPPGQVDWVIERSSGQGRAEKIVRGILEHEAKLAADAARDGRVRNAVNEQNYNFALVGRQIVDGRPCFVLQITPKHKQEYLVDGRAFVDSDRYQIRRIDGDLSKSPSWWLKSVHVTMSFGEVSGLWLQTATRAVADVRFVGEHTLTARALDYEVGESIARSSMQAPIAATRKNSRRHPSVMLGAGVLAPR